MTSFNDPDPEGPEHKGFTVGSKHTEETRKKMREAQKRRREREPPNENIDKACKLWREGKTIEQIKRSLKVSTTTVYSYLQRRGAQVKRHNNPFTPEEDDIVVTSRAANVTCASIGEALGRSHNSIASRCNTLRKKGVKIAYYKFYFSAAYNRLEKPKRKKT